MSSKTPVVKQTALLSLIPQIIILALFFFLFWWLNFRYPLFTATIVFLALTTILRFSMAFHHRRGMWYFKKKKYKEAIEMYKKSYLYFSKHPWIDRFRYITLFSSSKISYKEMALLNIAFSYSQIGDGENSEKYYKKTQSEFPDSEMAKTALKMIDSIKENETK